MKISHEVPLGMLEESRKFNDYDYALVNLFDEYPESDYGYYNFFVKSLERGREVILDNSLYELGESFNQEKYYDWVCKLNPTYHIIPDAFDDFNENMIKFFKWKDYVKCGFRDLQSIPIAVIHGSSYKEMVSAYKIMESTADTTDDIKIAFSFAESMYEGEFHIRTDYARAFGRFNMISRMVSEGIINHNIKHHLLGCSLPIEFMWYKEFDFIDSIDTSNPVLAGLQGIKYSIKGLDEKPPKKLGDYFDKPVKNKDIVDYNINMFRNIIERKI